MFRMRVYSLFQFKIPVPNLVLCFVVYTCFVFYCISAVLRESCSFCCSVVTATIINKDYYYEPFRRYAPERLACVDLVEDCKKATSVHLYVAIKSSQNKENRIATITRTHHVQLPSLQ